jgi:hypothetical protein
MSERSFEQKAATSLFKRNRLYGAGVDVRHAAGNLFVLGRFNGLVSSLVQTLDERASKVEEHRPSRPWRDFLVTRPS